MNNSEFVHIDEGVNDPAIFKAVFLAGGPGSGKSFIVGKTGLTALGFKVINSDDAFEAALKKAGLEMSPDNIFSPKGQEIRKSTSALTVKKMGLAIKGRLGLVVDGTGKDFNKIKTQANDLKRLGYEVGMIFVNTDKKTAMDRNRARARKLPDKMVAKAWADVQKNIGAFQGIFKTRMYIVDNSEGASWDRESMRVYKAMMKWVKVPPKSKGASAWIKRMKGMKEEFITEQIVELFKEDVPANAVAQGGVDMAPDMGWRKTLKKKRKDKKIKEIVAIDKRYTKEAGQPVLLKRFRSVMDN